MLNELTFLRNELTILWKDLTIDWNDLTQSDLNKVRPLPQFHGSFRSTTLIKKGFILVLRYTTFFPAFPWQEWPNYNRKIDNKRTHLWKKRSEAKIKMHRLVSFYVSTVQVSQRMRRDEYHVIDSSKVIGLESNPLEMLSRWSSSGKTSTHARDWAFPVQLCKLMRVQYPSCFGTFEAGCVCASTLFSIFVHQQRQ